MKKKGWYIKAKIKFIERNVYSYELARCGMFGNDYIEVRRRPSEIRTIYFDGIKADWQYDMMNIDGFAERFIWAQNLERKWPDKFYFSYKFKNNLEY